MSSNTRVEVAPAPTRVAGGKRMNMCEFFGPEGTKLLHRTLDSVLQAKADDAKIAWRTAWTPVKEGKDRYRVVLSAEALPEEVTEVGIQSIPCTLSFSAKTVLFNFEASFVNRAGLSEAQQAVVTQSIESAMLRPLNQLFAISVMDRLTQNLQKIGRRVEVSHKLTNKEAVFERFTQRAYVLRTL